MRTSSPPERAKRVGEQTKSQTEGQRSGGTEHGSGLNPTAGVVGVRQVSIMPPEVPEVTGSVGGSREEQMYISQTPMDLTASSPQAVGEAGALFRPLNQTEDKHAEKFKRRRHPSQTDKHELQISNKLRRKSENRDSAVSRTRGASLQEAAQQVREEDEEARAETQCPGQMQLNPPPFPITPVLSMEPSSKIQGETGRMESS